MSDDEYWLEDDNGNKLRKKTRYAAEQHGIARPVGEYYEDKFGQEHYGSVYSAHWGWWDRKKTKIKD